MRMSNSKLAYKIEYGKIKLMLSIQKQPKYLKKKIQLPSGEWAIVLFELQGSTWKAVYGEIIEAKISQSEILALPVYFETQHIAPLVSPFFKTVEQIVKDFAFVISQPTRAPGF